MPEQIDTAALRRDVADNRYYGRVEQNALLALCDAYDEQQRSIERLELLLSIAKGLNEHSKERIDELGLAVIALCRAIERGHAEYDGKDRHALAVVNHVRALLSRSTKETEHG